MDDGDLEVMLKDAVLADGYKMGRDARIDTWLIDDWLSYEVLQKCFMTSH